MVEVRIIDDTYIISGTLGKGYTSKVLLGTSNETGEVLAIKILKPIKKQSTLIENFIKEVGAMEKLENKNSKYLIKIKCSNAKGIYSRPGKEKKEIMYLGLEIAENGELFDYISDPGKAFSDKFSRFYFTQLILGLKSMHDIGVTHRDLKTENLFLDVDFNLKIGDFGFAKFIDNSKSNSKFYSQLGTKGYQSPELICGNGYDGKANDVFACGVILFIFLTGSRPFGQAMKLDKWYKNIFNENFEDFWESHEQFSKILNNDDLKSLLIGMLSYENRISIDDILSSSWIQKEIPDHDEIVDEMKNRKKHVVDRKAKEDKENAELKQANKKETTKIFSIKRDSEVEVTIGKLNQLDFINFPVKDYKGTFGGKVIIFDEINLLEVYKHLISTLEGEFRAEIELNEFKYKMNVIVNNPNENEIYNNFIEFSIELFMNYEMNTIVAELILSEHSNRNEFYDLVQRLKN